MDRAAPAPRSRSGGPAASPPARSPPGFEPDEPLLERVLAALAEIAATGARRGCSVVTHGGVVRHRRAPPRGAAEPVPNLGGRWVHADAPAGSALGERLLLVDPDDVDRDHAAADLSGRAGGGPASKLAGPLPEIACPTLPLESTAEPATTPELPPSRRTSTRPTTASTRCAGRPSGSRRGTPRSRRGGTHQARLERDVAEADTHRRLAALDIGDRRCASGASTSSPTTRGRRRRRPLLHRPPLGHRRRPRPARHRLARARSPSPSTGPPRSSRWASSGAATSTPTGASCSGIDDEVFDPTPPPTSGLHGGGRGRAARRARTAPHRPHGRHRRHDPGRAGRSDPRRPRPASSSSPAVPAPARPRSRCTAPRTSSTRTAGGSRRRACCSSGRARSFLRYIDQVLPSLGEDEVQLATVGGAEAAARACAAPSRHRGRRGQGRRPHGDGHRDARSRDRERPLPRDVDRHASTATCCASAGATRRASSSAARRRRGTHNERRPYVGAWCSTTSGAEYRRALVRAYRATRQPRLDSSSSRRPTRSRRVDDPTVAAALARGEAPPRNGRTSSPRRVRRARGPAALERMWPVLSGAELVHDLFRFPALIRSAADGVLDRRRAGRCCSAPRRATCATVAWTEADLALVDEADALLGPPRRRVRAAPPAAARDGRDSRRATARGRRARPRRLHHRRRASPPATASGAPAAPTTTPSCARSATCSSTRPRTSRRCSGACSPGAARRAR